MTAAVARKLLPRADGACQAGAAGVCRTLSNNWLNGTLPDWGTAGGFPNLMELTIKGQGSAFTGEQMPNAHAPPAARLGPHACAHAFTLPRLPHTFPRLAAGKLGGGGGIPCAESPGPVGLLCQWNHTLLLDQRRRLPAAGHTVRAGR